MKNGEVIRANKVILTTGTFLGGQVYIGTESREAGRFMRFKDNSDYSKDGKDPPLEPPSNEMAKAIRALGFPVGRLKTGTPPRLDYTTINFDGMEE